MYTTLARSKVSRTSSRLFLKSDILRNRGCSISEQTFPSSLPKNEQCNVLSTSKNSMTDRAWYYRRHCALYHKHVQNTTLFAGDVASDCYVQTVSVGCSFFAKICLHSNRTSVRCAPSTYRFAHGKIGMV
jgi:hypothetical protein